MKILPVILALSLSMLAACARISDVVAYETSIERVRINAPSLPEYEAVSLNNANLVSELNAAGFTSFLWLKPDQEVHEWYANGKGASDTLNAKSVSKVLFSTLVGSAITKGQVSPITPISDFSGCRVPEALAPLSYDVLLNMTAGFEFTENQTSDVYAGSGWACRAMALPVAAPSGFRFSYSTIQYHLAGLAFARSKGANIAALLQDEILAPMGITLDGWVVTPDKDIFVGSEMRLHPRDMLRFGHVFLQDGRWTGKQVVPQEWVLRTRAPQQAETGRKGIGYSWGWWLTKLAGFDVQFAEGYGGQAIIVVPEAEQVFVFTAPTGGLVSGAKHDARIAKLLALTANLLEAR